MLQEKLAGAALALLLLATAWTAVTISARARSLCWQRVPGAASLLPGFKADHGVDPFDEFDALALRYGDDGTAAPITPPRPY
ncbi:MAG TPA: hypothetical protein VMA53_08815 [Stellaceae bacterium]|nr:hypothetical protein [Stellaceae bacterium]